MEYILKQEIRTEKAIVRVFSPVLDDKERAARLKQIYAAAIEVMKERR